MAWSGPYGSTPAQLFFLDAIARGSMSDAVSVLSGIGDKALDYSTRACGVCIAAYHGQLEILKALVRNYPDILLNVHDNYPVRKAAKYGHVDTVSYLLTFSAVDACAANGDALVQAIARGHLSVVEVLLAHPPCLALCYTNYFVYSALGRQGSVDMVRLFGMTGALMDLGARTAVVKEAMAAGHVDIVRYMVDVWPCAYPQSWWEDGFVFAARLGHVGMVEYLLSEAHVNPGCQDDAALRFAAAFGHIQMVHLLLERFGGFVNPAAQDHFALRHAAMYGYVDIVQALLGFPMCDARAMDQAALRFAARAGQTEMVSLLLAWRGGPDGSWALDPTANCNEVLVEGSAHDSIVRLLLNWEDSSEGRRRRVHEGPFWHPRRRNGLHQIRRKRFWKLLLSWRGLQNEFVDLPSFGVPLLEAMVKDGNLEGVRVVLRWEHPAPERWGWLRPHFASRTNVEDEGNTLLANALRAPPGTRADMLRLLLRWRGPGGEYFDASLGQSKPYGLFLLELALCSDSSRGESLELIEILLTWTGPPPACKYLCASLRHQWVLGKAVDKNHADLVRYLLTLPDVDPTLDRGHVLWVAIVSGYATIVNMLLAWRRRDVCMNLHLLNDIHGNLVSTAVKSRNVLVLRAVLSWRCPNCVWLPWGQKRYIDLLASGGRNAMLALELAVQAKFNSVDMVRELLSWREPRPGGVGLDISGPGVRVVEYAASSFCRPVAKMILRWRCATNLAKGIDGPTFLRAATWSPCLDATWLYFKVQGQQQRWSGIRVAWIRAVVLSTGRGLRVRLRHGHDSSFSPKSSGCIVC